MGKYFFTALYTKRNPTIPLEKALGDSGDEKKLL